MPSSISTLLSSSSSSSTSSFSSILRKNFSQHDVVTARQAKTIFSLSDSDLGGLEVVVYPRSNIVNWACSTINSSEPYFHAQEVRNLALCRHGSMAILEQKLKERSRRQHAEHRRHAEPRRVEVEQQRYAENWRKVVDVFGEDVTAEDIIVRAQSWMDQQENLQPSKPKSNGKTNKKSGTRVLLV